jgi:serine/threonine protein kinase
MANERLLANRYRIIDTPQALLGRGGVGNVYQATDVQSGSLVAVKALSPEALERDERLLERFQREGEALRRLNHPNIIKFIAAIEEDGRHYLVMEYVPGGSLQGLLKREKRLAVRRALEISLPIAEALTHTHRVGILHRDLKPANVLLAEDGTPRLADFGIARRSSDSRLTETGVMLGTVDYLSPEACRGQPFDEHGDLWSLGVMLYEMVSGQLPFGGTNLTAKIVAIITEPTPEVSRVAPDVPAAVADLLSRMLQKDRPRRLPSAERVSAELEAILHQL